MENNNKQTILSFLSLFTSFGTLLCCALPALLVTLGMGAVMAGLVSAVPWITALSAYKKIVFSVAGIVILLTLYMQWRARYLPCPVDPVKAKACSWLRALSFWISIISLVLYLIGVFFAFFAADLLL